MPSRDKHLEQHDAEIFDDSDFYSKLLRELIDSGTKNSMQAAMEGRDFLKKSKKQVEGALCMLLCLRALGVMPRPDFVGRWTPKPAKAEN